MRAGPAVRVEAVPLRERAAGPDLARGLALLGIALSNTIGWLYGSPWTALAKQADASALDRTVDVLVSVLVDNRGFPLFALLFGYGIGVLWRRGLDRGEGIGRFRLRMLRRHLVLLAIGLVHMVLLFSGDIVTAYAIIGMIAVLLVDRGRIFLIAAMTVSLPALGLWGWLDGTAGLGGGEGFADPAAVAYSEALALRTEGLAVDLVSIPAVDLALLLPMLLGILASRIRLLEDVEAHRELLGMLWRRLLPISVLGALPLAAVIVVDPWHEILPSETVLGILGVIHQVTGVAGAVAYACLAALLAGRLGGVGRSLVALGRMSLTAYVLQSAIAACLFAEYALGLGGMAGTAGASAVMAASWAAGLALAVLLGRWGRRGPLEMLLRRLGAGRVP